MSGTGAEPPRTGGDPVEQLYLQARDLEPGARAAFLAQACAGDARLESELKELLAHAERAEGFFADLGRAMGRRIGHYRLLEPLGTGGMGAVYRAHDIRLDRQVALKFLPPHLASQPTARERLLVEARAAAALEHPNVCTVYEIGEAEDGRPFIAMACYEGETLKERLLRGPLPLAEATAIAAQVAGALEAAHARGIVHRDVKPGNIMLVGDGTVRLLDFGLAKLSDVTLTGPGVTPGTIAYMSPEQARGDPVDRRTDLWSLGVVLYEMLAGRRPFRGESDRVVIEAILHQEPEPLTPGRPDLPAALVRTVDRLLLKDPASRFHTAADVLAGLRGAAVAGSRPPRQWRRILAVLAGVAGVGAAGWLLSGPAGRARDIDRLAVLPLADLTGDPRREYFVEGMQDALVSELSRIPGLVVISRQSTLRYRQSTEALPRIARELGVDALLEGSVYLAGDSVRITLQLVRADPEEHIWSGSYQRGLENALALQRELARGVAQAIHSRAAVRTPTDTDEREISPEAQDAYLRGLYQHERVIQGEVDARFAADTFRTAIGWLEKAVALAPHWAAAHAKLARAYHWLASFDPGLAAEFYPKSKAAAQRALELDERVAQAHASLGFVLFRHDRDWEGAERSIRRAIELDPNSHRWIYALYLMAAGRPAQAAAEFRRARERDPLSTIISQQLALAYACDGRLGAAMEELNDLEARLNGSTPWLRSTKAAIYLDDGKYPQAIAELETLAVTVDSDAQSLAELANGYARAGREADAFRLLARIDGRRDQWHLPELDIALGDTGRAVASTQAAFAAGPSAFLHFRCSPVYRELRGDPRIQRIVRELRFPD